MRKRAIAHWVLLIIGLLLVFAATTAGLLLAASMGAFGPEWLVRSHEALETAWGQLALSDETIKLLLWFGGISGTAMSGAFALLVSWHFAEMNLPQRLKDLVEANTKQHLLDREDLLAVAKTGLGGIPADIEMSRFTLLLRLASTWSEKNRARYLAASANVIGRESLALRDAANESQQREITARLIRGYQRLNDDDHEAAFKEFDEATRIREDDLVSRDIAAGCARRLRKRQREVELLEELRSAAQQQNDKIMEARALRRLAELTKKPGTEQVLRQARDLLTQARALIDPPASREARIEAGRILTLFCEVQEARGATGHLDGPNGPMTRMIAYLASEPDKPRAEEEGGEPYGGERAERIRRRIRETDSDPEVTDA